MSDEIEIEFARHTNGWEYWYGLAPKKHLFSAKSGMCVVFRDSPLEAICALVEFLAS